MESEKERQREREREREREKERKKERKEKNGSVASLARSKLPRSCEPQCSCVLQEICSKHPTPCGSPLINSR